ncbi:SURF1 family protein [Streptomyces sp. NPDC059373]
MYRFLLTPRWLAGHLFVVLAVIFCVFMGSWQLSRFESRVESQRTAEKDTKSAAAARPVSLTKLLPGTKSQVTTVTSGREVTATGRYDTAHQLLVPERVLDGRTGFYVLTPLRVNGGAALPVVRGWLPGKASAAAVPAAPEGEVTVTGALQAPETTSTDGVISTGGLPEGQLGMISAASLVNLVPYDVYSAWITQTDATAPLKAVPPTAPANTGLDLKAFQNLGYTGEWFVFAGFVVFMWFRLFRREAEAQRDAALGLPPESVTQAEVPPREAELKS